MGTTTASHTISSRIRVIGAGIVFGLTASLLSSSAAVAIPKDCFNSPFCNDDGPVVQDPTPPPPPPPPPTPCKFQAKCPVYDPADQVLDPGTGNPEPEPEPEPDPEEDGPEEDEPEEPEQDEPEQDEPEDDEPEQDRPDQTQPGGSAGTPSRGGGSFLSDATFTGELLEVDAQASEEDSTDSIGDLQQAAVAGDESGVSSEVWIVLAVAIAVAALTAGAFIRRRRQSADM